MITIISITTRIKSNKVQTNKITLTLHEQFITPSFKTNKSSSMPIKVMLIA